MFGVAARIIAIAVLSICIVALPGCALIPETRFRDSLHNPFPQIKRVAVLPFYNQSSDPSVNGDDVAAAYYAALQAVPGFEVLPVGVTKAQWFRFASTYGEPQDGPSFQRLAKHLGVEAIVVGSVTDFQMYYPPRLAMTVHWYAANEGFHPIPAGYGLPWGTEAEKQIPRRIVREAEFELARSQLATQSPLEPVSDSLSTAAEEEASVGGELFRQTSEQQLLEPPQPTELVGPQTDDPFIEDSRPNVLRDGATIDDFADSGNYAGSILSEGIAIEQFEAPLPTDWPDPTDLIPDPPSPHRAPATVNHKPILSHTKIFRADDPYFTKRLSDHVETGDDARPGGWQGYLKRSDDFIRFCCHLHIAEMLESRGELTKAISSCDGR